ncbi:MAG: MFS transporter, partial [Candidatus Omnitrophica bacterium]|nr:MFS transporter [Candidatus Omnitrophota bacterium]
MEKKGKGFIGLIAAQALGALNDNAFKLVVSLLAVDLFVKDTGGTEYVSMVGVVFILPFLMLTTFGGYLADRFSKRSVIIYSKAAELLIMFLALPALAAGNTIAIYSVLFLMGAHSALSSPAKYGIMPEMFGEDEISEANGSMHLWTYVSIIIGTAFGGYIFYLLKDRIYQTSYIFMGVALVGLIASFFVAKVKTLTARRKIELNIIKEIAASMRIAREDSGVFLSILGLTYFGLIGGLFQLNILLYARKIMEIDQMMTGMLLTVTGAGMAAGSYLAGRLSGHKVEYGLVPLGGFGISASLIFLGFTYGSIGWTAAMLFLMGVSSGFFVVPLNALIQIRVAEERRGQMIAALNFLSFSAILLASGVLYVLRELIGLNSAMIFLMTGVCSIAATLYIFKVMPEAFVRLMNWILAHSIYRITLHGEENIPRTGGALLVCNHVSYADPLLVMSSVKRSIRFMVFRPIYENPVIKPFCRITGAIPVSFADRPKSMLKSLHTAKEAIRNGEVVCIFAEGGLTRTGNLLPFNKGFEYIMKDLDAPIIPMNIDRIWGSVFSYKDGKFFRKIPRRWPYPITVSFAPGMPANSTVHEVRTRVEELSAEAMRVRKGYYKKLHIAFIDEIKRHPFRFLMADSMGVKFNCIGFLAAAAALQRVLFKGRANSSVKSEMVGVLLPSSCIGALVNTAILLSGKVPVNLNFTSSKESIEYAVKECSMRIIV